MLQKDPEKRASANEVMELIPIEIAENLDPWEWD